MSMSCLDKHSRSGRSFAWPKSDKIERTSEVCEGLHAAAWASQEHAGERLIRFPNNTSELSIFAIESLWPLGLAGGPDEL